MRNGMYKNYYDFPQFNFILNKFVFNCTHYLHIIDSLLGTTFAPFYSNKF